MWILKKKKSSFVFEMLIKLTLDDVVSQVDGIVVAKLNDFYSQVDG